MNIKGIDVGFTDSDTKQGIVSGYFSIFNNKDLDGDVIEKGAFSKTILERGVQGKNLIKYLLDHDKTKVVAKITELYEDEKGLRYTAKIGSHALGQDFQKMIESELINQHSFGYKVIKNQYDQQSKVNRIKELMMFEGSAVQFLGANPETSFIDLKSFNSYLDSLESFVKSSDATDETLQNLEIKLKSLHEMVADKITPIDMKAENTKRILQIINQKTNGI